MIKSTKKDQIIMERMDRKLDLILKLLAKMNKTLKLIHLEFKNMRSSLKNLRSVQKWLI